MICDWDAYIHLLPLWLRNDVDKLGRDQLQELRLRVGYPAELVLNCRCIYLNRPIADIDIQFVINTASRYSPWTADSLQHGYITAAGGHRIGVCGSVVTENGSTVIMKSVNMICMRVARDIRNVSQGINTTNHSVLIIGRPGCGKTTLLRDLIRRESALKIGSVSVIDERCELFPIANGKHCFEAGSNTDVLSGVGKKQGVEMLLRCMNPNVIAMDEITSYSDCEAVISAGWCGVRLFATAHAGSRTELLLRPVYKQILDSKLFDTLVVMHPDKSWSVEGMFEKCTV